MADKNFETPIGVARFPKTDKPYKFDQKTKKSVVDTDEGSFQLEIVVPAEAAHALQEKIKAAAVEGGLKVAKVKNWPWKDEEDKDTGEATGNIIFKMKRPAKAKSGLPNRVVHVDSRGRPLPAGFSLTNGSRVRANGYLNVFETLGGGVSLRLDSVQVIKLQERGPRAFSAVEEDDAYEYEADGAAEPESNAETSSPSDGGEENYNF